MSKVIEFPPAMKCQRCDVPLRPATQDEIRADVLDERYRHIAITAAQGDRDFDLSEAYPEWLSDEKSTVFRPTWLLRCDRCDMRTLWSRQEEE